MIALNETLQASQHGYVDTITQMAERGILDPKKHVGVLDGNDGRAHMRGMHGRARIDPHAA